LVGSIKYNKWLEPIELVLPLYLLVVFTFTRCLHVFGLVTRGYLD